MDQTDSLAQRDTGWIQLYCEDGQDVFDTTLKAFRLAESVNLPVMVVLDAFFLSHTYEPVDVPDQGRVDRFLPPYVPRFTLDIDNPCAIGQMAPPSVYMEMRHNIQAAMNWVPQGLQVLEEAFERIFGRRYGMVEDIACGDADIVMVVSGTMASTCRQLVSQLRAEGVRAGRRPIPALKQRA